MIATSIARTFAAGSLLDFFQRSYVPLRLARRSPATTESYETTLLLFARWYQARAQAEPTPADVTEELLCEWLSARRIGKLNPHPITDATYNRHLRAMRTVLRLAAKKKHAVQEIDWPELMQQEPKLDPDAWTLAEFTRLLNSAVDPATYTGRLQRVGPWPVHVWFPAVILTVFSTGLRISAIMQLQSAHFDAAGGTIKASWSTQKQKADQTFALLPATVEALNRIQPADRKEIFGDWPYDRRCRQWQYLTKLLAVVLKTAGLATTRRDKWHKLRRMFGTQIAMKAGVEAARILLGHSSASVTARYIDPRQMPVYSPRELLPPVALPQPPLRVVG